MDPDKEYFEVMEQSDVYERNMEQLKKGHEKAMCSLELECYKECMAGIGRIIEHINRARSAYKANGADRDALVLERLICDLWCDKPWVRRG